MAMKIQTFAFSIALAFAGIAHAADLATIDKTQRVDAILSQQAEIRGDVQAPRNGWDALPQEKRSEVLRDQDRLFQLLQDKQTIGDLAPDRQVEAANLLSSIKAIATNAEDERMVCTRERKVGSNFTQRVCRTVAEMRREREAARDGLQRSDQMQRMQPKTPGGVGL
jgi:hypothetical protein